MKEEKQQSPNTLGGATIETQTVRARILIDAQAVFQ